MQTFRDTVAFGEIMLRLSPPRLERLLQSPQLAATFGGSEANAAVAMAQLGARTSFVTVLPDPNPLAESCIGELRRFGVDTSPIVRGKGRMGLYFLEPGAGQRPTAVFYDRAASAMAMAKPGDIDWDAVFQHAGWFHISGITPAISQSAAELSIEAVQKAKAAGLTVSCDINYRKNLWQWGKTALEVIPPLVRFVDIVIANEADLRMGLGFDVPASTRPGYLDAEPYRALTQKVLAQYPAMQAITVSLREPMPGGQVGWSSCLDDRTAFLVSRHYPMGPIVDGVGAGDCFAGAFIYGWQALASHSEALEFAVAASCLKHTVPGDFSRCTLAEIEALLRGSSATIAR
jgi:2-dehydro-3-deoxygluconokinase